MTVTETDLAKGVFFLTNLDCSSCAAMITKSLKKLDGIRNVGINYITDKVYVSYDPAKVTPGQIKKAIENVGYKAFEVTQRSGIQT